MINCNSLAPWQRLASERQQTYSFFNIWEPKKHMSTNVYKIIKTVTKSCKYCTNRIANLHKMLWTRNPGKVVKTETRQQQKVWKSAGSLRAAWSCFWMNYISSQEASVASVCMNWWVLRPAERRFNVGNYFVLKASIFGSITVVVPRKNVSMLGTSSSYPLKAASMLETYLS